LQEVLVWVREIPHAPAFSMGDCTLNRVRVQEIPTSQMGHDCLKSSGQTFIGPVFF
jgi:hypothetical protein